MTAQLLIEAALPHADTVSGHGRRHETGTNACTKPTESASGRPKCRAPADQDQELKSPCATRAKPQR